MKRKINVLKGKKDIRKTIVSFVISALFFVFLTGFLGDTVSAESSISIDLNSGQADNGASTLDLLFLFAFIALIPTFLMMMTCFTRLVISFSF